MDKIEQKLTKNKLQKQVTKNLRVTAKSHAHCQTITNTCKISKQSGLEVIKLELILRLKIKCNDWLLADTCPPAANHCALC